MQVRKWLISGEINYNVCRICSLTLLPPEVLIPTPITLSVVTKMFWCSGQCSYVRLLRSNPSSVPTATASASATWDCVLSRNATRTCCCSRF